MTILPALILATSLSQVCIKAEGENPTPCEVRLLDEVLECKLESKVRLEEKDRKIEELTRIALKPPPEKESYDFSLFGLPAWVTPVIGVVLFSAGMAVGLSVD